MMAINSKWLAQETKMKEISTFDDLQFMLLTFSLFFCPFILSRLYIVKRLGAGWIYSYSTSGTSIIKSYLVSLMMTSVLPLFDIAVVSNNDVRLES